MNNSIKQMIVKILSFMPDKLYLSIMYKIRMGKMINWKSPKTLNEKIQWLKVYDRKPEYTQMADKYAAKEYVARKIGEKYLIPTLGVWDSFEQIDFRLLPDRFVLKCTHDSGGLVVCRDKSKLDVEKARKILATSLKTNYFYYGREWPYKNIKPRIIAEKYMEQLDDSGLTDYKFYCFNGKPQYLYVSKNLEDHHIATVTFVDMNWNKMPVERTDYKSDKEMPIRPSQFDEMRRVAEILSKDHRFLRVDLYQINGEVYFSELTFHPASGYMGVVPSEYDEFMGQYLKIKDRE